MGVEVSLCTAFNIPFEALGMSSKLQQLELVGSKYLKKKF